MKAKKRFLSLLLCGAMLFSFCPQTAFAEGADLTACEGMEAEIATLSNALAVEPKEATGVFTVNGGTLGTDYTYTASTELEPKGGDTLTIKSSTPLTISTNSESETTSGCRIVISDNVTANITLAGVDTTPADAGTNDGYSGIDLGNNATLNITLQSGSSNVINGGTSTTGLPGPGIHVPEDSTLTITGNGSLEVHGASGTYAAAVGIGGMGSSSGAGGACGNVIILGGTITVHGGTSTTGSAPVDIGGGASDNGNGGNCSTVIILTSVNSNGNLEIGGGAGVAVGGGKGSDGAGIKPSGDGTYTVYGDLELPCDITIPEGATVTIPGGASMTVPDDTTLTNNGTILVQGGTFTKNGTVSGNQPTYPSKVTVSFSQNGEPVTSVPYGSTVTITATMEKAETAANALSADPGKVDFYLGDANDTTGIKLDTGTVEFKDGAYTASVDVTLNDEKGVTEVGTITITADFGGYAPEGEESGDSLAPNTGSAELTVTKAEQTAPTGTFLTTSNTENSITVTFTDVTQTKNENGIEIAYAVGPTASEPTSDWTTATKSSIGSLYTAEIENLSPGTPYIFFARYKGDDTHEPSPAIASSSAFYTKPKITTQGLPNAYVGVEYSKKLEAVAAGGVAVNWAIAGGTLPAGLTLSSDGTISGTPTTAGQSTVIVKATIFDESGQEEASNMRPLQITISKSDAELGGLTVSGQTGFDGHFQYGDTITVTFTPEQKENTSTNALAENTATLTYTSDEGEEVTLATATAQADGSFELTYDTKEKKLPIGENLTLTVSYGGNGALNPVKETVTLSLDKAILKNMPTVTGSFVYGETLTVNYTKQDDESVTYQWYRGGEKISDATENSYILTAEDISKNIYVIVSATDEWHRGAMQSRQQEVAKAQGSIEIACESVTYGGTVQPSVASNTNTGADVAYSYAGTDGTSYGPSSEAPQNAGTYTVTATVAETATHTAAESEPVAFTISKAELAAPQNLTLASTAPGKATATWGTVENASGYTAQLYKDGQADGDPIITTGTSCEFSIAEAGSYTVKVKANGSDNYADSQESSPSAPLYFGTVNVDTEGNGTASASVVFAAEGTEITLTVNADADSHFVDWEAVPDNITITDNKFTMPAENVEIKAVFEEHTYTDWEPDEDGTHSRTCTVCGDTQNGNCSGGEATCTKKAVCDACGAEYGVVDPTNHTGEAVWVQTATTHKQVYNCCQAEASAKENHNWENGKCTVCNYPCIHTGGKATCSQLAVCDICGSQYGALDPDNHKAVSAWTQENGKHYHKCEYGCDTHLDEANCSGGEATCTAPAVCEICGNAYGAINPDNHTGTVVWTKTATTHSSAYDCCNALVVTEEAHEWENGVCSECGYECQHDGGTATCSQLAVCDICGSQYGDYDADNHKAVSAWTQENGKHYHKCEYGCDTHLDEADCLGGEATCTAPAVCETCGNAYGAINPDNHTGTVVWTKTATTHSSAYSCCNAPVVAEEVHEWQNGVCSECGYECQHDGGTATCTQKAVCDICGEEYGEVNASTHTNLVKTEAKAATHMAEGNIEYWYCDGCDKYFSDEAGTKEIALANTVIPKLTGHTADGTGWHSDETNHWNTCECGEKLNEAAHTFEWVTDKEATATEAGSKHEKCTVCGYEEAAVEIPATGTTDPSEPPTDTDKPSGDQTGDTTSPQTGDDSNIALWMALMLAAGAVLTGTAVYSRKRKYSR